MNLPAFSIIVATYKRPQLLSRAMRSVINQTFRDFECIVVDDADNVETAQIVKQFNDKRIVLIQHKENKDLVCYMAYGIDSKTSWNNSRMKKLIKRVLL